MSELVLGWREWLAIALAASIIVDVAAWRTLEPRRGAGGSRRP